MELFLDVLLDTVLDSVRLLPFLLAAFLLLEALEHRASAYVNRALGKVRKTGPLLGALFGCVPQCGFSVMASNLYAGGVVSLGTLMAVFVATSDEAVLILMGHPGNAEVIIRLLLVKFFIAVAAGYVVDALSEGKISYKKQIGDICNQCGCHDHEGILRPALRHTGQVFLYVFLFSGILNLVIGFFGPDSLSKVLLGGSALQPFVAALFGFIPNCAASVLLTELYLGGTLSFASVVAGLCTNAGVGLIVLFKVNQNRRENVKIAGILYGIGVLAGVVLNVIGI